MRLLRSKRSWWLGLAVVAAMVITIPTALAQGPEPAWVPGGETSPRDSDDGYWRLEFGIEAPDSGFASHPEFATAGGLWNQLVADGWGAGKKYIWIGANAWEEDWKRASLGGTNASWADDVDFAFYVGHGSPSSFTFNGWHDDNWLTYQDAYGAWGDKDLEWVGLLSCQVLAESHRNDWAWTMNGLHLLMGFKTNASAGYPGFGTAVGQKLRANWTVAGAWLYGCDTQQGTANIARILAEDALYWGERPDGPRYGDLWDNWYQVLDHTCGSEYPRQASPLAGNVMPIFETPKLSFAEAAAEWNSLTTAFGLRSGSTTVMAGETMSGTESGGRELIMDPDSGLFYFLDHNNLFTITAQTTAPQASVMSTSTAQAIATYFLTSTGLMPADAQFYEVAANGITEVNVPGRATGAQTGPESVSPMAVTDYSVIFSRILTYAVTTSTGVQAVEEYSVGGPGAKMKVYVNPTGTGATGASIAAAAATDVVGAQGGWRRIDNNPAMAGVQASVMATETILDYSVIQLLFEELEQQVALAATALPNPTSRTILDWTVFFWEEPTGVGQAQLFPSYDLEVEYVGVMGGEVVTFTDHSYIPAAPEYMRPYAEIVSSNTQGRNFGIGQVLTATAADASLQLSALGYTGLNFVLGSGDVTYQWYVQKGPERVAIGTPNSRELSWTINGAMIDLKSSPAIQTLILEVTDNSTDHASQGVSSATIPFTVVPPVYLPMVSRM